VGGVGRWADRAHEVTRKESSEGVHWRGERHRLSGGFVTGKEDLNSITRMEQIGSRAEGKKTLDKWNFRSLAVVIAEIVKI
jgi:hypothetical protein